MGEKSRRKREERARREAMKRLAERNRTGKFSGSRATVTVGGVPIGPITDVQYAPFDANGEVFILDSFPGIGDQPHRHRQGQGWTPMPSTISGTFKVFETAEALEQKLKIAEAKIADLQEVLKDAMEERGLPRSPMLARLMKVPDVDKVLEQLYLLGVGYPSVFSQIFNVPDRVASCCSKFTNATLVGWHPSHDDTCPLQEALLAIGGRAEVARRLHQAGRISQHHRYSADLLIVSPQELAEYRRVFGEAEVARMRIAVIDTEYHPNPVEMMRGTGVSIESRVAPATPVVTTHLPVVPPL